MLSAFVGGVSVIWLIAQASESHPYTTEKQNPEPQLLHSYNPKKDGG